MLAAASNRPSCKPLARHHLHQQQQINHADSNSCLCYKEFDELDTISRRVESPLNETAVLLDFCSSGFSAQNFDENNNDNIVIDSDNFSVNRNLTASAADNNHKRRPQKTRQRRWTRRRRTNFTHFQATARGGSISGANILFTLIFDLIFCRPLRLPLAAAFWPVLIAFLSVPLSMTLAQLAATSSSVSLPSSVPPVVDSFSSSSNDASHHPNNIFDSTPPGIITDYYDYERYQPFSSTQTSDEHTVTTTAAAVMAYDPMMENITMNYYTNLAHTTTTPSSIFSSTSDFITSTAANVFSSNFELFRNDLRKNNSSANDLSSSSTPLYTDFTSSTFSSGLLPTVNATAASTARWLLAAATVTAAKNSSAALSHRGSATLNSSSFGEHGTFTGSERDEGTDPAGGGGAESVTGADIKTLIVLSVLYGIISITAIVGNFFVIWIVATCRRMQSVTNYLLSNLALADMLIGALSIPFQFQAAVLQRWDLPPILCPVAPFVQSVTVTVSIISLTVIACDRYRAFIYPLKPRLETRTAYIIIPSMWVAGVICGLPQALALRVIDVPELVDNVTNVALTTKPFCYPASIDLDLYKIYSVVIVVLQYFIPLIIIIFCYSRIGKVLWWDSAMAPGEQHHTMLAPTTSSIVINNNNSVAGNTEITTVRTTSFGNSRRAHAGGGGRGRTRGSSGTLNSSPSTTNDAVAGQQQQQQHTMQIRTTTTKQSKIVPAFAAADNSDDGCTSFVQQGGDMPSFWAATINSNNNVSNNNHNNSMRMKNLNSNASMRGADSTATAAAGSKQLQLRQQQLQMQHSTRETNKRKVIKMLILVVSMFALCWVPLQTYNVLFLVWEDVNRLPNIMIIWLSINWLAMSNSSVNPIIYGIYNDRFRKEFRKKVNQCFLCRKPPPSPIRNRTYLTVANNNNNVNNLNGIVGGTVNGGGGGGTSLAAARYGASVADFSSRDGGRAAEDGVTIVGGVSTIDNEEEEENPPSYAIAVSDDRARRPKSNTVAANHRNLPASSPARRSNNRQNCHEYSVEFSKTSPPSYNEDDDEDDDVSPTSTGQQRSMPPSITVTPLLSTTSRDSMYINNNNSGSSTALLHSSRQSSTRSKADSDKGSSMPLKISSRHHGKHKVLSSPTIGNHNNNSSKKCTTSSSPASNKRNIPKISIEDDFDLKDDDEVDEEEEEEEEDETGGFGQPYHSNRNVANMRNQN